MKKSLPHPLTLSVEYPPMGQSHVKLGGPISCSETPEKWEMRWIKIYIYICDWFVRSHCQCNLRLAGLVMITFNPSPLHHSTAALYRGECYCWQGPTKGQSLLNLRYVLVGTLSLSGIWTWGQWIGNKQQFALRKSIFFLSQQSCELEMCECLFS